MANNKHTKILLYAHPHPLLIPTIAQKILRAVPHEKLKTFRLVCSQWDYEASRLLRHKTLIRLVTEDQVAKYLRFLPDNWCCQSFEFGPEAPLPNPVVQRFFNQHGKCIKSLKIHSAQWNGFLLWTMLFEQLPFLEELSLHIFVPKYGHFLPDFSFSRILPNMKYLKLSFTVVTVDYYWYLNPTFLREFFQVMPNLERIFCPNWPTVIPPATNVGSLVFNTIFMHDDIQFKRLTHLHINCNVDNDDLGRIQAKCFPLKELWLELEPDVQTMTLYSLLKSMETTLTSLVLSFPYDYVSDYLDDFPGLRGLKYLCLHRYQAPLASLNAVIHYLPSLKTLVLNDVYLTDVYPEEEEEEEEEPEVENAEVVIGDLDDAEMNQFVPVVPNLDDCNPQLEELYIEEKTYTPIGRMLALVRYFPNLKNLRLPDVNDSVLQIIYTGLPELEDLVAIGKFTDAGVTGIPLDICKEIYREEESFPEHQVRRLRVFPYIGNLTRLKRLELDSNEMTYLSILLGVNDCQLLEKHSSAVKLQLEALPFAFLRQKALSCFLHRNLLSFHVKFLND